MLTVSQRRRSAADPVRRSPSGVDCWVSDWSVEPTTGTGASATVNVAITRCCHLTTLPAYASPVKRAARNANSGVRRQSALIKRAIRSLTRATRSPTRVEVIWFTTAARASESGPVVTPR